VKHMPSDKQSNVQLVAVRLQMKKNNFVLQSPKASSVIEPRAEGLKGSAEKDKK